MILNDAEIRSRINAGLIVGADPTNVQNCAYVLRAGKAFEPESGEELTIGAPHAGVGGLLRNTKVWTIRPAETLIVMTRERLCMPADLCATYAPLNRLARQGVLLLNASLVEPGYDGHLSGFLVNFSRREVVVKPDEPVAKITFHQLTLPPVSLKPYQIAADKYEQELAGDARGYHKSFLNVSGIEERAAELAIKDMRRNIVLAGIFVALLLLFSSLQPFITKYVVEPLATSTQGARERELRDALDQARAELKKHDAVDTLQAEVVALKEQLVELRARLSTEPAPAKRPTE